MCIRDRYEAIELLKGAGGMAVVAHPMKIKGLGEKGSDQFFENLDSLIRELKMCIRDRIIRKRIAKRLTPHNIGDLCRLVFLIY